MKITGAANSGPPLAVAHMKKPVQIKQADETIKRQASNGKSAEGIRDTLEISKEVQEKNDEMRNMQKQMANFEKAGKDMSKNFKVQNKCVIIASRIMDGDEVPLQDHRYLAKNSPGLYGRALIMRVEKPDPVKHKQISKDDNNGGTCQAEVQNAGTTAALQTSAAVESTE